MHDRILLTYGHSIENSLLCSNIITDISVINGGEFNASLRVVNEWRDRLTVISRELIVREVANELSGSGLSVFGDHYEFICGRGVNDGNLPQEKIEAHIENLDKIIPEESIKEARGIVDSINTQTYWYIKGHFLFSVAVKLIKFLIKKISGREKDINLPNEALNIILTQQFKFNIAAGSHPHKDYYDLEVAKIERFH